MAEELHGKFKCVLLTPHETLLECTTRSLTLPAHDGQMGIWRDHMPMLCRMGKGIMEVQDFITAEGQAQNNARFQIDGGFVQICNNVVTILAYNVNLVEN